jgi:hydrogenase maturation protease
MRSSGDKVKIAIPPLHPVTPSPCHLVIAYGNPLRQDDAAGLLLASRVVEIWRAQEIVVQHIEVQQLMPELATRIADAAVEAVFFFDAALGEPMGALQVRRVDTHDSRALFGHHLSPPMLMAYANLLYAHCPAAWLVTVPGANFCHGEGVSLPVQRLIATAVVIAEQLLALSK